MDMIWSSFENLQRKILGSAASSSRTAHERVASPHWTQINDSLYEVHTPEGRPEVEILFFHGLQLKGSRDGQFSTWLSGDGSEFWLDWIPSEIPGARVLTVSYDDNYRRTPESGRFDVYLTGENLLSDLLQCRIGRSGCPVVLVGHSFGGLIIKQLCVQAESTLNASRDRDHDRVLNFLINLKGIFFYASPHYGSKLQNLTRGFSKGSLFDHVTILDTEAARLNDNFSRLRKKYRWQAFGIGESLPVTLGGYRGLIVEEASARLDVDGYYTVQGDHFTVCQPRSKNSRSYALLVDFVNQCLQEDKAERSLKIYSPNDEAEYSLKTDFPNDEAELSLKTDFPNDEAEHSPTTDFPQEFVGLEGQTLAVIEKLDGNQRLCLVGVQGIGKTTLVEAVYNKIKDKFDYTCFFGEAGNYLAFEEHPDDLRAKIRRRLHFGGPVRIGGQGRKVSNNFEWSGLKGKKVLIAIDDVVSESQVSVMTEADDFSHDSRIIVTAREREFLVAKNITFHFVEKLDHEDSLRLFCLHAFQMANVPKEYEGYLRHLNQIEELCEGLPLKLRMAGRQLYTRRKVGFESQKEIGKEETLHDFERAIIESQGSIGHPHLEGVSTQSQEIYYSVKPASPYDEGPQDAEDGMVRSREGIEKQTQQDQEGAGKAKAWAQEKSKEPTIMDEDHDVTANEVVFVAEEDAIKLNVTDEDKESNSGVGTPRNHLGHEKQQEIVKDVIREINRGKSGYVVSKAWLFSLEEHYKETVMSELPRAGYFEFYQTRTKIIYRRIENSGSQVKASDVLESEMSTVTAFENKLQLDIVRSDDSSRLDSPTSLPHKGKTALASSNEKVESFKTALKDTGPYGYFVSTQWLSTLSDHEVEDLNVALSKAGYSQVDKTSTTTYFKRHNCVYNNPGSRSEIPSSSVRTIIHDRGRPSTSHGTEISLPEELQDVNMDETKVTSKIQEREGRRVDCECVPQYLTVSCTPSSRSPVEASTSSLTSSLQGFSEHVTRQRVGDCLVTMPKKLAQRTMNTRADKSIEIKTIDFNDMETSFVKTGLLNVSAETSLCCCITSDKNDKKVRFEFLQIQGAVKMEESMKREIGLVLRALRTNVVAYITKAEQSEGSEHMPLRPWFGEQERLQGQTRRPVRLEISANDPEYSDPGSTTLELQCLEAHCTDSDASCDLLFNNYGPRVVFEGDLDTDHDQNFLLQLNLRYQLKICYDEYLDSLPQGNHFLGMDRKIEKVNFDCILEFSCRVI